MIVLLCLMVFLAFEAPIVNACIDAGVKEDCRLQVFAEVFYSYPPHKDSTIDTEIHSIDIKGITIKEGNKLFRYDNVESIVKDRHLYVWRKYHSQILDEIKAFALTYQYKSQRTLFSKVVLIHPSRTLKKRIDILKKLFLQADDSTIRLSHSQLKSLFKARKKSINYISNEVLRLSNFYLIEEYYPDNPFNGYNLYIYSPDASLLQIITDINSYISSSQADYEMINNWLDNKDLSNIPTNPLIQEIVTVYYVCSSSDTDISFDQVQSGYRIMH